MFGYGKLKFGWSKSKLAPNLHLVLPVQNMTGSVITLEPGYSLGLAHRWSHCSRYQSYHSLCTLQGEQLQLPDKSLQEEI